MLCELCGQDMPFLKPMLVEGSLLKVCPTCAKFGKEKPGEPRDTAGASVTSKPQRTGQAKTSFGYGREAPSKDEVIRSRLEQRQRRKSTKDIFTTGTGKELAEDYHKRIQRARNELDWSQEQLGQKINERKSVISKIENKSMKPDDKLVRKLEKALGISLMEDIEE